MPAHTGRFHLEGRWIACLLIVLLSLSAGCSGAAKTSSAPAAVEAYLTALVNRDANRLSSLSCAAWEAQARQELTAFTAVKITLQDPNCQETGKNGNFTLVSCSGKIVANYNGEDSEISLEDRVFKTVQEGGDWRMCGYQ